MAVKTEVLVLFDPKDRVFLQELKHHLFPLEREGLITVWDEDQIVGGTNRRQEINHHLQSAPMVLWLVSANFMASESYDLAIQALAKHIPPEGYIIPVLLHEVDWEHSDFGQLAPLPANGMPISSWSNRNAAYVNVVKGIREILAAHNQSQTQDQFSQPPSAKQNSQVQV